MVGWLGGTAYRHSIVRVASWRLASDKHCHQTPSGPQTGELMLR